VVRAAGERATKTDTRARQGETGAEIEKIGTATAQPQEGVMEEETETGVTMRAEYEAATNTEAWGGTEDTHRPASQRRPRAND
jgi:hypothetical protein